jgi:hypothetical protein
MPFDPFTVITLGAHFVLAPQSRFSRHLTTGTSATLAYCSSTPTPTSLTGAFGVLEPQTSMEEPWEEMVSFLELSALSEIVLAGSRPMLDWERQSLGEFMWAELEA